MPLPNVGSDAPFAWGDSRPYTPAGERIQDAYLWEGEVQPTSVPASGAQPMHMPAFASVKIEKSAEAKAWEAGVDSKIAALQGGLQKLEHSSVASNAMMGLLLKANNVPQEEIDAALAQIWWCSP